MYAADRGLACRECAGCGEEHIHSKDDYLCWECRGIGYRPVNYTTTAITGSNAFYKWIDDNT